MNAFRTGAVLALAFALLPSAGAAPVDDALGTSVPVPLTASTVPDLVYVEVQGDRVEVWRETNGCPGLQTKAGFQGDGTYCAADTKVLTVPP